MARERIATREAVFEAANQLANGGERVTVTAVRETIGGGSNSSIQELLVDWRRDRRAPVASHANGHLNGEANGYRHSRSEGATNGSSSRSIYGLLNANGSGNGISNGHANGNAIVSNGHANGSRLNGFSSHAHNGNGHLNGGGAGTPAQMSRNTAVAMPDPMRNLMDSFTNRLSLIWADSIANASTNDQLAVIRAAAEARVREADDQSRALEEELVVLQNDIVTLRAERDGYGAALETANDRAAEGLNEAAKAQQQLREVQDMATDKIARLKNERDAFEDEIAVLKAELESLRTIAEAEHMPDPMPAREFNPVGPEPKPGPLHASVEDQSDGSSRFFASLDDEVDASAPFLAELAGDDVPAHQSHRQPSEDRFVEESVEPAEVSNGISAWDGAPPGQKALLEAVKAAEKTRDILRVERDRLAADIDLLQEEKTQMIADMARMEQDFTAVRERMEKQAAWITEARARMSKAGLLKPKRRSL